MSKVGVKVAIVFRRPQNFKCLFYRHYGGHPKDKLEPPGRLKRFLMVQFEKKVDKWENFLQDASPSTFKVYKQFKLGFSALLHDIKIYYTISKEVWKGKELHTLSRNELVIYRQVPTYMFKAVPLVLASALPMALVIVPALAYKFPKLLLTHHFWTKEIKKEVFEDRHEKRIRHLPLILDKMEVACKHIPESDLQQKMNQILQKLEHSLHPTVDEILEVKPVFEVYNFKLGSLTFSHHRHLASTFGFSLWRSKLDQQGLLLLHTDLAMLREGFRRMTDEEIDMSCFQRGLNPYGLKRDEKEHFLHTWTRISKEVDENSMSLLLHAPVLLTLNHPTNINLIGGKRSRWRRKLKHRQS